VVSAQKPYTRKQGGSGGLKRRGGSVSGPADEYRNGVLIVCRRSGIIPLGKMLLRTMGYLDVHGTTVSNNGLVFIINDLKPRIMFVEAGLYHDATPFRMEELLAQLPGLKIAAFSLGNYADSVAVEFKYRKLQGYINLEDGICEFRRGLKIILNGERYFSKMTEQQENLTDEEPKLGIDDTAREREVLKLITCGLTSEHIAKLLNVSVRTVDKHRGNLLRKHHAANTVELTRISLYLGHIEADDFHFYRGDEGGQHAGKKQRRGIRGTK
jgi:DNA-binding NarL/FixJ family response regulator